MSERYVHYNTRSRGIKASWDHGKTPVRLVNGGPVLFAWYWGQYVLVLLHQPLKDITHGSHWSNKTLWNGHSQTKAQHSNISNKYLRWFISTTKTSVMKGYVHFIIYIYRVPNKRNKKVRIYIYILAEFDTSPSQFYNPCAIFISSIFEI